MPNLKASIKDVKKTAKRREDNLRFKLAMKKIIKETKDAVAEKADKKKLNDLLQKAYKTIDKNVKKKTIHKNNAARKKSKLAKLIAGLVK
ncbi:MAG: 30S ribosomal protein S20 [Patescibacteria group bacterium]|nr:30S ribosomal protein S20 [Patescibacteria group bacterium]